MRKTFLAVFLCIVILRGCNQSDPAFPAPEAEKRPPEGKTLTLGLIPEHDLFRQTERCQPLILRLSEKMGMEIRTKILSPWGNLIDNFISENLDGACFGSFTYALAHAKLNVTAFARHQLLY